MPIFLFSGKCLPKIMLISVDGFIDIHIEVLFIYQSSHGLPVNGSTSFELRHKSCLLALLVFLE
jgi:hypothetical protein